MAKGTCQVDDCQRLHHARGLCYTHYFRMWRTGDVVRRAVGGRATTEIWDRKPAQCAVPDCDRLVRDGHGGAGYCSMHYQRFRDHGDPMKVDPNWRYGENHRDWLGDAVGYRALHRRIEAKRGCAADHRCQHCGGQAQHWAYDHTDPAEKRGPMRRGSTKEYPYSTDPSRYMPLCVSCHQAFDRMYR